MHEADKMITEEKKIKYDGINGICHIRKPGNAVKRHTGSWRINKPIIDHSKCISCKTCFVVCPDSAIHWKNEKPNKKSALKGKPIVDYTICKGCGVCSAECPVKCIAMKRDLHEELK
jgi:2-oxoacid:acceptor oxidoreductase delta subunit (pyruvate/2-ketoisovalerate family)